MFVLMLTEAVLMPIGPRISGWAFASAFRIEFSEEAGNDRVPTATDACRALLFGGAATGSSVIPPVASPRMAARALRVS
jgi:hypothetical protein